MKLLIPVLLILVLVAKAVAGSVMLGWDPFLGATNFVVVADTNALSNATLTNALVKVNVGLATNVWIYDLKPGRWNFGVVSVSSQGVLSDLSNLIPVDSPSNAPNARVVTGLFGPSVTAMSNVFMQLQIR